MAINYIEKGRFLHDEISAQGFQLYQNDAGVWISDNDIAVQAIIDTFDPLPRTRREKRREAVAECVRRANERYNDEENLCFPTAESIRVLVDIDASYRSQATGVRQRIIDVLAIYSAFQTIRSEINALTDVALIEAYDVVNNPLWPVV